MADTDDFLMGGLRRGEPVPPDGGGISEGDDNGDGSGDEGDLRAQSFGDGDDGLAALKPDAPVGKWTGGGVEAPRRLDAEGDEDDEGLRADDSRSIPDPYPGKPIGGDDIDGLHADVGRPIPDPLPPEGRQVGEGDDDDDELSIGRDLEVSDLDVDLTADAAGLGEPGFEVKELDDMALGVDPGTGDDGFTEGEGVPDDFG